MTPSDAALQRLAAIEALQAQLATNVSLLERQLLEGLLLRLEEAYNNPSILPALLDEFTANVHLPVLTFFGQSLLELPTLTLNYFAALDGVTDYARLRAPLRGYLQRVFGLTETGAPGAGGLLATYAADQTVRRELLAYSWRALTTGIGLQAYRQGLTELVTGPAQAPGGLYTKLYRGAADLYNEADRVLQTTSADTLGLTAFLYQGGLIASSRAFCKVRNGKVFLREEIERFGTAKDAFGGYTNKSAGEFSGKPEPYEPVVQLGGYGCRHGLNAIPNVVAMSLRPELREDAQGRLVVGG